MQFLFRMFLNHSNTACEFFHWLTCTEERTSLLILSRIILLSFPMSDLDGLISRHDILCGKSPIMQELENFENELLFMIKNIQFRKVNTSFQSQLNEDIKQIKGDSKILVPADKFCNIYQMDRETIEKLLHENGQEESKSN